MAYLKIVPMVSRVMLIAIKALNGREPLFNQNANVKKKIPINYLFTGI
jgi:hypothetical protein